MTVNQHSQYKSQQKAMMAKFFILPVVVLLALFSMATLGMKGLTNADSMVSAKALNPNDCVSGVKLSDLSHPSDTTYSYYDTVQAKWTFNIPTDQDIEAGDTLTLPIPSGLTPLSDDSFDIKSPNGDVFAHVVVDKESGTVKLTFEEPASIANKDHAVKGDMELPLTFKGGAVTPGANNNIDWGINGWVTPVHIDPNDTPDATEEIFKWSYFDQTDENLIHWRVRYNALSNMTTTNGTMTDTVYGTNHSLVASSIHAYVVNYTAGAQHYNVVSEIPASQVHQTGTNSFTVNIGNLPSNEGVVLEYDTRITDGRISPAYGNGATFTNNGVQGPTADAWQAVTKGGGGADNNDTPVNPTPNPTPTPTPTPTPAPTPNKGGGDNDNGGNGGNGNDNTNTKKATNQSKNRTRNYTALPSTAKQDNHAGLIFMSMATAIAAGLTGLFGRKH
ncbi:collagen binding domain-containing protein [Fructobacillus durionis]|uniref:Collagen binding domain-containing protein n=1 Tax=Fructobacillus durionis TaxID=283737 RepID=A0A1I1G9J6_9LACO|nr:collagen binding domain-containing protein [Fructobacillus durionis]SFC06013.1 Collagen binding domain-containing protein [Fructobacillus durionis]